MKIKIEAPRIDEKELDISFAENVLKISRKDHVEAMVSPQESRNIVAQDARSKVARGVAARMAKTDDPVLIYGENGTGKGLYARSIHEQGGRKALPFVSVPCGAIDKHNTKQLMIDYLVKVGHGTLLLDGIQDLDIEMQRVLQKIIRIPVEQKYFRLLTTTSTDLYELVRKGFFSGELLTLIQGCYIELLPLQQRKEDIESLVTFYMEKICRSCGLESKTISPDLLSMLESYPWPGNVLELVNTIEQLLMTAQDKQTLFAKDLPTHIRIQTINSSAAQKKGI
ncbi:sigma 54-interacting transcriptional regulator [Desulfuromusa kysingii]|uniref:sigma 54-interacting transcriptional regulator n=1 Tax=Desulfuromusa kysingii TaxID=37625 RepID=UPI001587F4B7|nr:sigma 54-interacting transcriptional regulator [Desulfuromusa kysingii]